MSKGLQPQFPLLFEGSAGRRFDELLCGINAQLFELLHARTLGNRSSATNAKCEQSVMLLLTGNVSPIASKCRRVDVPPVVFSFTSLKHVTCLIGAPCQRWSSLTRCCNRRRYYHNCFSLEFATQSPHFWSRFACRGTGWRRTARAPCVPQSLSKIVTYINGSVWYNQYKLLAVR
jgi:hypothetical protein